jgi:hypothetical protein
MNTPIATPTLDNGLTINEIAAVSYALAREVSFDNLIKFADTFSPVYTIAFGLLRARAKNLGAPDSALATAVANGVRVAPTVAANVPLQPAAAAVASVIRNAILTTGVVPAKVSSSNVTLVATPMALANQSSMLRNLQLKVAGEVETGLDVSNLKLVSSPANSMVAQQLSKAAVTIVPKPAPPVIVPRLTIVELDEFGTPISRTSQGIPASKLGDGTSGFFVYRPKNKPPITPEQYAQISYVIRATVPYEWIGDYMCEYTDGTGRHVPALSLSDVMQTQKSKPYGASGYRMQDMIPEDYARNPRTLVGSGWGRFTWQKSKRTGQIGHPDDLRTSDPLWQTINKVGNDIGKAADDAIDWVHDNASELGKYIGQALKLIAPIVACIPGIGTGIAYVMSVVGSVAMGEKISDALLSACVDAVPGGALVKAGIQAGVAAGKALLEGKNLGEAALAAARSAAVSAGGEGAGAAFDAGLALARGKSLQEAGFQALYAWTKGNDLADRAAHFAEKMAVAVERGQSVADVLIDEAKSELEKIPLVQQVVGIEKTIAAIIKDPGLLLKSAEELAKQYGVPVETARAALMSVKDLGGGNVVVDPEVKKRVAPNSLTLVGTVNSPAVESIKNMNLQVKPKAPSLKDMVVVGIKPISSTITNIASQLTQTTAPIAAPEEMKTKAVERAKWVDLYQARRAAEQASVYA